MESEGKILEIASASKHIISAATEYASRRGFVNVQSCHFRLEKEMQRISVAARGISDVLGKSSLPNGPPLDDRLQDWLTTDELPTCLDTLHQMDRILQSDTWMNSIFNVVTTLRSVPPEDKIDEIIKLFDSRRNYFHFLLTTDVWNCEEVQQPLPVISHDAEDWQLVEPVLELNIHNVMAVVGDDTTVPFNTANRPTIVEEQRSQMDNSRKLDDVLRWLDGLSCAAKQEETLSLRQPDTCTWLYSTPEYESWRNSDDSFLWLQGKPGSGKTVLTSFVIDLIKNKRHSGEALAFFYCDFRNDRSTSAAEVMRSLLSQLLCHTRNETTDLGELLDDLAKYMDGDISILENVKHLATFVSRTAKQFSHQPLIVVDALDECKDIESLLDSLLALAKGSMRLFVTSRPLYIIKDQLRDLTSISMDRMTNAVSADIGLHVTRELDSHRRLRDLDLGFKMEIHSVLCDRADGMFRWVQCQIDTLNRCTTKAEVRGALDNLPIGLDETYQRILATIDVGSPEGKLALRALVWLVGALRPLRLPELLEGLAIDLERRTMDPDTGLMHKDALLDACGSLVTYNEDTDILILSHFSVKEYLVGDLTRTRLPRYHINHQGAHEHLARLCICYLTLYLHASGDKVALPRVASTTDVEILRNTTGPCSQLSENSPAVFCTSQKLLNYVLSEGFNHLAYLGSANHVVLEDMVALQLDILRYPDAWEAICRMKRDHKTPIPWPARKHDFMFYILVAFSSASLFLAFLRRSCGVLKPQHQTNPLVYAAHFGKVQHAEMLLSHGAKVNERGLVIDASRQALPLEVAVGRRRDIVVNLLLSAGSMVPKRLFALSTYYYKFPVRIVRMLLETDEFVEWAMEGNTLPSSLRILEQRLPLAYENDIMFILRRLLQAGVTHTEQDSVRSTVLHSAILGGYRVIVAYLLQIGTLFLPDFISVISRIAPLQRIPMLRSIVEAGVDVHTHVAGGDTMLHLAVTFFQEDCLAAVKILVGAGAKPFMRNTAGKTPLHLALEKGKTSVADYMLSRGTPPSDVLLAVVESRCPVTWRLDTLRVLANDEADTSHNNDALLYREMMFLENHESLEMAKLSSTCGETLLDLGMDHNPSLADYLFSTGRPPLDAFAVLRSNLSTSWKALIICSLVGKGVDVCGLSAGGNTLLHAAVFALDEHQGLDVVKILIGAGCDPFRCSADGKTPLHVALDRNFPLIANYLLSVEKPLPPDALFAILYSTLPASWRARTVTSLVGKGVDVCGLSADGNTLLHATLLTLDEPWGLDVAKRLVDAGCDPVQYTANGKAPLHIALDRSFLLIADYLLSIGRPLPPDAPFAILHSALPADWKALQITSLIVHGVDACKISADGNTLLYTTVLTLDELEGLDVAKLLVDVGCDPFLCSADGKTPLHVALDRGFPLIASYLLSISPLLPPDAPFAILHSPLPVEWKVQAIASAVVEGVDVCEPSADGNTLLHAVGLVLDESLCLTVIELLIGAGSDPSIRNMQGKTILHIAAEKGYITVMEYILSLDQSLPDDILFSVLRAQSEGESQVHMLSMLISEGANTRAVDVADGNNLLHVAIASLSYTRYPADFNSLDLRIVVELLVASGCDAFAPNFGGKTPLHLGVARGYITIIEYLLSITASADLPADILACALQGEPERITWNTLPTLQLLIDKGANVDVRTADGDTLLHMAIEGTRLLNIVMLLVDSGCDPSRWGADGRPPIYLAITKGCVEVVEYLLPRTVPRPRDLEDAIDLAPYTVREELKEVFTRQGYVLEME
ncbi:ankyrin repeat-containing domain protein [Boletus edulis BED1]|uniref:Ankyrin repeat-containing domain protein n=1 Tax=Boletus edulis BED1 TaxID=1328754 RepID=A0AAD4BTH6_BOLED|nr:ankyrin repeat-containing domain protein [Boletus edulis BED1]